MGLLGRFCKTLKTDEVYWRLYDSPAHCRECPEEFRRRYDRRRPHGALIPEEGVAPLVPEEVCTGGRAIEIRRRQGGARGAKQKLDQMLTARAAKKGSEMETGLVVYGSGFPRNGRANE